MFQLNDVTTFKVTGQNADVTSNVTNRQKIIELIQQNKNITTNQMAKFCA